MSADIVNALEWGNSESQYFVGLGLGRDEAFLYESPSSGAGRGYLMEKVAKIDTIEGIETFNYMPSQAGVAGFASIHGKIQIINFYQPNAPALSLQSQQARRCNALVFNRAGLCAAGLDRARNEDSLLVWDVHYAESGGTMSPRTLGKYLPNEVVASLQFVVNEPNVVIAATYKSIRQLDVRSGECTINVATKYAAGLRTSLVDENRFLSYSESGSVALWDRRQMNSSAGGSTEPLLLIPRVFGDVRSKSPRAINFSPVSPDEFGVLHDGGLIRRWMISMSPAEHTQKGPVSNLTSAVRGAKSAAPPNSRSPYTLFVNFVHDLRTEQDKVVSFDYVLDSTSKFAFDFACIRQSGQPFRMPVTENPRSIYFTPSNDLLILNRSVFEVLESKQEAESRKAVESTVTSSRQSGHTSMLEPETDKSLFSANDDDDDDEMEDNDEEDEGEAPEFPPAPEQYPHAAISGPHSHNRYEDILQNDITRTMEKRAMAGYSADPRLNYDLLQDPELKGSAALRSAWKWLVLASEFDRKGLMSTNHIDSGFGGVASIWDGLISLDKQRRLGKSAKDVTEKELDSAVNAVVAKFPARIFVSQELSDGPRQAYRQLCLRVTGWDFPLSELETKLEELEKKGLHEKAAAWAVFHGKVERAVESLSRSRKRQLRLMSSAVAGYPLYKNVQQNNAWREQARKLASEMSVPYLRAIFAYISDGSWSDVLDDGSLPLTERLGISLRFLSDQELSRFLTTLTNRAIQQGDLEGILLTGLTPKFVDLLQSYVNKTGDVQTAAVISSFATPRFFNDTRCDAWVAEYRIILNRWRLFGQRAKFDVARNKLAVTRANIVFQAPIPKQAFLRCVHCKAVYGPPPEEKGKRTFISATRCPNCNYPLPRCAVCAASLGPSLAEGKEDRWPTFCMNCNHGYHSAHAKEWFAKYDVCPVPECHCLCGKI